MQQKTEMDGEIKSWIYEQARIDDDDIVAMYNTTMGVQHIKIRPNGISKRQSLV